MASYSLSIRYAKHQFLTTYFDPFYADLYLYPTKPDAVYDPTIYTFSPSSPSRAVIAEWLEQLGAGFLVTLWTGLTEAGARWLRIIMEAIPDEVTYGDVRSWPPT